MQCEKREHSCVKCALVYIDDIIIYSRDEHQHVKDVKAMFKLLEKSGLKLKESKCVFASDKVELLDFEVSADGIAPLPAKTTAIRD